MVAYTSFVVQEFGARAILENLTGLPAITFISYGIYLLLLPKLQKPLLQHMALPKHQ